MANFRTDRGNKATDLNGSVHLHVHYVSKERLELLVQGMSCVELGCCELYVSFVDSLDIRRIINCALFVSCQRRKGPVIKYLLGGVEDILGGCEKKSEPLRGVPKY